MQLQPWMVFANIIILTWLVAHAEAVMSNVQVETVCCADGEEVRESDIVYLFKL